jgi:hypothetical protein
MVYFIYHQQCPTDVGKRRRHRGEAAEGEGDGTLLILDTHMKEFKRNNPQVHGYR